MKLKIYHFANLGFGLPFLENYKRFDNLLLSNLDITVVFSTKHFVLETKISMHALKLKFKKTFWKKDIKNRLKNLPFKLRFSDNINNKNF